MTPKEKWVSMSKVKKAKAANEGAEQKFVVPKIRKQTASITIIGDSPLLVNKFSEKAKKEMLDKQTKTAKGARQARDPLAEVAAATYKLPNGKYGIPASGLKNCAVSACRFIEGVAMTQAKGSFFVMEDADGLCEIKTSGMQVDERMVAVGTFGNKTKMARFRPRFDKWSCTFKVVYDPDTLSAEQLLNLYERAGFSVGLCEYRPEKSGSMGMFSVKRA